MPLEGPVLRALRKATYTFSLGWVELSSQSDTRKGCNRCSICRQYRAFSVRTGDLLELYDLKQLPPDQTVLSG